MKSPVDFIIRSTKPTATTLRKTVAILWRRRGRGVSRNELARDLDLHPESAGRAVHTLRRHLHPSPWGIYTENRRYFLRETKQ